MRMISMTDRAIAEAIGSRLDTLRLQRNIGQQKAAEESGISRETLRNLIKGKGTLINLIAVLRSLGELERLSSLVEEVRASPIELAKLAGNQRIRASAVRKHIHVSENGVRRKLLIVRHKENKDSNW